MVQRIRRALIVPFICLIIGFLLGQVATTSVHAQKAGQFDSPHV